MSDPSIIRDFTGFFQTEPTKSSIETNRPMRRNITPIETNRPMRRNITPIETNRPMRRNITPIESHVVENMFVQDTNGQFGLDIADSAIKGVAKEYGAFKPTYREKIPQSVTDFADAINDPESFVFNNPEWQVIDDLPDIGVNVIGNETTKEVWFNFRGFDGNNAMGEADNALKHIPLGNHKAVRESEHLKFLESGIADIMDDLPKEYKVKFNGHSYGGWLSRYFAGKYDAEGNLLNAHINPLGRFAPTKAKLNYHTAINDPTNLKNLVPNTEGNHYFYPNNVVNEAERAGQTAGLYERVIDPHYISAFDKAAKANPRLMKAFNAASGVFGLAAFGVGVANFVGKAKAGKDRAATNSLSETLNGFTESGMVGLNLDSEYQYDDDAPPQTGFDWLAYKAAQPLKDALMSSERKLENKEQEIFNRRKVDPTYDGNQLNEKQMKAATKRQNDFANAFNKAKTKQKVNRSNETNPYGMNPYPIGSADFNNWYKKQRNWNLAHYTP